MNLTWFLEKNIFYMFLLKTKGIAAFNFSNYTFQITTFVSIPDIGQFCEKLYYVNNRLNNRLIQVRI